MDVQAVHVDCQPGISKLHSQACRQISEAVFDDDAGSADISNTGNGSGVGGSGASGSGASNTGQGQATSGAALAPKSITPTSG